MGSLSPAVLSLLLLVSACEGQVVRVRDSPVTCSTEGVECEISGDNLIDAQAHVDTLLECRQLCLDDAKCQFISYFDDNAAPLPLFCQLFNSCESVAPCSDCVSENMECFVDSTCGNKFVGDLDENIQDLVPNVDSEAACQESCSQNSGCHFYTYFTQEDEDYPKFCFLLAKLSNPITTCDSCSTGPKQCSSECTLENGKTSTSVMVTNTSESSVILVNGLKCKLTFLVVGGGGNENGGDGGGGSGCLEYRSLQVSPGTVLTARVGDQRLASSVSIFGGDTVTAEPGQDSQGDHDGGAGYSGGGGVGDIGGGGGGGADGGDGEDGSYGAGGAGTGVDVSLYTFSAWTITPGAGGNFYYYDGDYHYGGGGGGLLVDGEGPEASEYQGQGFGGGGSGKSIYGDGLKGLILIETTPV